MSPPSCGALLSKWTLILRRPVGKKLPVPAHMLPSTANASLSLRGRLHQPAAASEHQHLLRAYVRFHNVNSTPEMKVIQSEVGIICDLRTRVDKWRLSPRQTAAERRAAAFKPPRHISAVGKALAVANSSELKWKEVAVTNAAEPCSGISVKNSFLI